MYYSLLGKVGSNSLVQVLERNLHRKIAAVWRWAFERRLDSALKRPANRGCVAPGVLLDSALKRPAAILLHETAVSWLRKRLE